MSSAVASHDVHIRTEIRGAPAKLFKYRPREVVISGPAGTGKTRAILEFLHQEASASEKRILILRKTHESARQSTLVTYTQQVLHEFDGKRALLDGVTYHGVSGPRPAHFKYEDTGSVIVTGGMDRVDKVLSTEWDIVYINECTELTIDDWETILTRTNRPTFQSKPSSMVLGDCNPNVPTHWILNRSREGALHLWRSVHEDNPAMWDRVLQCWTDSGQQYLDVLDKLTGVRYQRLRLGNWVAAEGQVYENWNDGRHMVNSFPIPDDWPRFWVIDFGFRNPFVWQWWARSPDGDLYRYREIYLTQRLVEDHARDGMLMSEGEPKPTAIIVDHDAEDRATFERHTRLRTTAATKNVSAGIQAVAERLGKDGTRPRLFLMRDALVERDSSLREAGLPTCTEEEFPSYVWNLAANRKKGEEPVKENDHGMDATRYMVAYFDVRKKKGLMTI